MATTSSVWQRLAARQVETCELDRWILAIDRVLEKDELRRALAEALF